MEHGDKIWFGLAQGFHVYQWREAANGNNNCKNREPAQLIPAEIYETLRTASFLKSRSLEVKNTPPIIENYKKKKFDTDVAEIKPTRKDLPHFRIVFADLAKKQALVELGFGSGTEKTEYKIGTAEECDVKLSSETAAGEEEAVAEHHATLKKINEFSVEKVPPKVYGKIRKMLGFMSNLRLKDSVFKVECHGQFGVIVGRKQPFVIEPNMMEVFQIGNLLIQISRY